MGESHFSAAVHFRVTASFREWGIPCSLFFQKSKEKPLEKKGGSFF